MGPNSIGLYKGNIWTHTQGRECHMKTDTQGEDSCEDRGRDWRDAATSQGTPQPPKAARACEGSSSYPGAVK